MKKGWINTNIKNDYSWYVLFQKITKEGVYFKRLKEVYKDKKIIGEEVVETGFLPMSSISKITFK